MITHLQGRLVEKHPTAVVIDCNGVGYWVNISLNTYANIGSEETLKLYTHLQVREDAHTLYGFYQSIEREVFRLLLSVSGIGANTARIVLSSMTSSEVCHAIESENVTAIQAVKGIGLKTAQRVIIDLKDKISGISDSSEILSASNNTQREEALSALEVLGYSIKQTQKVIDGLLSSEPNMTVERLIKNALNKL